MNKEIEARFLDIDKQNLTDKLTALGASDKGDVVLTEVIFYDQENKWPSEGRFVRIRSTNDKTKLTYKSNKAQTVDSAREIEFAIPDADLAEQFLENIGLVAFRHQEKRRHTFELNGVTIDIDTWPRYRPMSSWKAHLKSRLNRLHRHLASNGTTLYSTTRVRLSKIATIFQWGRCGGLLFINSNRKVSLPRQV